MVAVKQNTWKHLKFKDIETFLKGNETRAKISMNKFAQAFGVSNSTFHNWKGGRAVPADDVQERLANVVAGKIVLEYPVSRAPGRPKNTEVSTTTLASLREGAQPPAVSTKPAKKKTKKVTKKKVKKVAKKKFKKTKKKVKKTTGRKVSAGVHVTEGEGRWIDSCVGNYLANSPITTLEELGQVLGTVNQALV